MAVKQREHFKVWSRCHRHQLAEGSPHEAMSAEAAALAFEE